jgi:hypothetical protein
MESPSHLTLADHFASLDDPRIDRTKLHPLLSIITIAICAVIAGAELGRYRTVRRVES